MSEREINERRNWKAQVFPYDYFIPDDSPECQYCLTDKQAEILRGIIEPLAWRTRWWSDSDTSIDQDAIQAFRDDLTRRLMMSCCGDEAPIQYRWTVDGVLQQSTDGGATWEDAPGKDPRNNSPQFPPTGESGEDAKCIAATGMAQAIKEQVGNQLTDDMSRYTLGQLITDWVQTMIQTSNPFEALITIATNQIFALVIATLRPALTDTVYDTLQCIFYCRMAADQSFNATKWAGVRSDITDQIGGIAGIFLEHLVYLLGPVGLTNLARSGFATTGDCDDCECPDEFCPIDWTWYGCDMTQSTEDPNTWSGFGNSDVAHFAFSSGDPTKGCYWDIPLLLHGGSIWYVDGTGPVPADGIKSKTVKVWNYDNGPAGDGTPLSITFSPTPIP